MTDDNITLRKHKRGDDGFSKAEVIEMFSALKTEQEEKFTALMNKIQCGITTHTEQNKNIVSSIDLLAQKYEEALTRIKLLEQKSISDDKYIQYLVNRLEYTERNQLSSSLEIRNITKKDKETKEDLCSIVQKVGDALKIPIQAGDIRDIFRPNTKNVNNQPIVVHLNSVFLRDKVISSVKEYNRKNSTSKFSSSTLKLEGPSKPIFISESLTSTTKKLFFRAREFARGNNYKYCWCSKGNIFLRRIDGDPLIKIKHEKDLEDLKTV